MSLQSLIGSLRRSRLSSRPSVTPSSDLQANTDKLPGRLLDVFLRMWDLGFTAFGGPPVHFQILHRRFVEGKGGRAGDVGGKKWLDEQAVSVLVLLFFPRAFSEEGQKTIICTVKRWRHKQENRCLANGDTQVSRTLRDMSSSSWSCIDKIMLLYRSSTRWFVASHLRLFALESPWCNWHVCTLAWCTKHA